MPEAASVRSLALSADVMHLTYTACDPAGAATGVTVRHLPGHAATSGKPPQSHESRSARLR